MRPLATLLLLTATLAAQTRYEPNWTSLDARPTPAWFSDARFGIFIHWGVYSVPSYAVVGNYSEWYWNSLTNGKSGRDNKPNSLGTWYFHRKNYGEDFPYFNFAPMFRAEMFDANHWADVFAKSGARYVVLTSKHHDGFALWPSEQASKSWGRAWNAVETGPKRDLLGDLTTAVRSRGLRMGFYYSLYEWYNPLWLKDHKRYATEHMHPQFKDAVTRYKPSIIFSDGEWDMPSADWKAPELLAWLYNDSPVKDEVVVNDRWGKETRHKHGGYYTTEYTAGLENVDKPWEENRGMGFSFGYNRMENLKDYRSARELVLMLIDLVSRGGNLLLDIGPTADGRIPVVMEERLTQIGEWLGVNGDAIYGTHPWKKTRQWSSGKQPEFKASTFMTRYEIDDYVSHPKPGQATIEAFFTAKGETLYAIIPSPGRHIVLKDVPTSSETKITLLGAGEVQWKASGSDIEIELPDTAPAPYASVLKIGR